MSLSMTVTIDSAKANASLRAITRATADRIGMHGHIAQDVKLTTDEHLRKYYLPRDKGGVTFWGRVVEDIKTNVTAEEAKISLTERGIGLRYHGGDVRPGKSISSYTGRLTVALAVPSKDVTARDGRKVNPQDSGLLAFVRKGQGKAETIGWLFEGQRVIAESGKHKGKPIIVRKPGGNLLYTLRTITRHKGDHKILPPRETVSEAAKTAIRDFIDSFE